MSINLKDNKKIEIINANVKERTYLDQKLCAVSVLRCSGVAKIATLIFVWNVV
jgi:hypothetical protein